LKQNDDQECEREHQQQPALHPGILLRIVEFRQIRYSVTAQLAGGALVKDTPYLSDLFPSDRASLNRTSSDFTTGS
jgi:hypothetical protein